MPQVKNIRVDIELFPSILHLEFDRSQTYSFVNLSDLDEAERKIPLTLLNGLRGDSNMSLDYDNLLLVKLNQGFPDAVYGASLYRESLDSKTLVVKFGRNIFPVTMRGDIITVGDFLGKFLWETKLDTNNGIYRNVWLELASESVPNMYFSVPLATSKDTQIPRNVFRTLLRSGLGIAHFLQVASVTDRGFAFPFLLEDLLYLEARQSDFLTTSTMRMTQKKLNFYVDFS